MTYDYALNTSQRYDDPKSFKHTHTHSLSLSLSLSFSLSLSLSHTHTLSLSLSLSHTHTHTQGHQTFFVRPPANALPDALANARANGARRETIESPPQRPRP